MIYTENIQVDAQGRFLECPVCKNTQFPEGALYCIICGMSRINLCLPEDDSAPQHENPVNARFCEYCGAKTLFFQHKLLLPWEMVPKEAKKEAASQDDNEELPF